MGFTKRFSLPLLITGILLFALSPLYAVTLYNSCAHLHLAQTALHNNDPESAIEHFKDSISWRSPFNSYSATAQLELQNLITRAETPNTLKTKGYDYLVWGLTRSKNFLNAAKTDAELARIKAERTQLDPAYRTPTVTDAFSPRINYSMQMLSGVLFFLWIGSVLTLIWRAFSSDGSVNTPVLLRMSTISLLSYLSWLAALTAT